MRRLLVMIIVGFLSSGSRAQLQVGTAKATLLIVDQDGIPVPDADVYGAFRYGLGSDDSDEFRGRSDTQGRFVIEGTLKQDLTVNVKKEGFYKTIEVFGWDEVAPDVNVVDGKWQPWNPMKKIIIKEIKMPVPLIVRNLKLPVTDLNVTYGLDLMKGDWVAPHGKGNTADILVEVKGHRSQTVFNDWSFGIDLSFPNEYDGIQQFSFLCDKDNSRGSELRSAHNAPDHGYSSDWKCFKSVQPDKNVSDTQQQYGIGYYLRTRTEYDDTKKEITKAVYSKVYGRISGGMTHNNKPPYGGNPFIMFTYYINPEINDQNLEYDLKSNLAISSGISPKERRHSRYWVTKP